MSGGEIQVRHNGSAQGIAFVKGFQSVMQRQREATAAWVKPLREDGIRAAHPDDGWVDRNENTVCFCYPDFNDGAGVGDLVALGRPDEYRIVRLTGEIPLGILDIASITPPSFRFAATQHTEGESE